MVKHISSSIVSAAARNNISSTLTFPNYVSLPIPIMDHSMLFIGFLIGKGEVINPESGYHIWPPNLLALYSVSDGQFEELRALSPKDFSQNINPEQPLSEGVSPPKKNSTEYIERQLKLFQSFDNLVNTILSSGDYKEELKIYDKHFRDLAEPALIPYYRLLVIK